MKMHRFYLKQPLNQSEVVITDPALTHQIKDVLRLESGEKIVFFDGSGVEAEAEITAAEKRQITCKVNKTTKKEVPGRQVTLFCAVLKNDAFETVVQKATELGIAKIVPLLTHQTIKKSINSKRLEAIAREASEQSGRVTVPEISHVEKFDTVVPTLSQMFDSSFFCDFSENTFSIQDMKGKKSVALLIGPEGGWNEHERTLAQNAGLTIRSLGKTVLRADTAATVACFIACAT
jgi:16S rRNA (uracil1498-N3)-methyltransferase